MTTAISDTDRAYAAGIVDGEGCITISESQKRGKSYYGILVVVTQREEDLLCWLKSMWGGSIQIRVMHQELGSIVRENSAHAWHITTRHAARFLFDVLPYLKIKREQAELALALQTLKPMGRRFHSDLVGQQDALRQRIMRLNSGKRLMNAEYNYV